MAGLHSKFQDILAVLHSEYFAQTNNKIHNFKNSLKIQRSTLFSLFFPYFIPSF